MLHRSELSFANDRVQEAHASYLMVAVITIILGAAFFVNDFDWNVSTYESYVVTADEHEVRVATGSIVRRVSYGMIGLLGGILLIWPSLDKQDYCNMPLLLLGSYMLMCLASVMWSDDPSLTMRRLAILAFCVLGILGIVRHLSAQDLLHAALVIAVLLVGVGLWAEISNASFRPFSGNYRFAGTFHPNAQGAICATLVIAAFCGAKRAGGGKLIYLAVFVIGCVFLLLTKSRTSLGGCCFALYMTSFLGGSTTVKKFLAIVPPVVVCTALIVVLLLGIEVPGELDRIMQMGRETAVSDRGTLSGRIPLWTYLLELALERPLLGYGYHGFWTPDRIFSISSEYGWTVPNAHSMLIDVLLHVGLLGGACYVLGLLSAIVRVAQRCATTGSSTACFAFAMVMFAVVSSMFESGFVDPTRFESFFAVTALTHALLEPSALSQLAGSGRTMPMEKSTRDTA